MLCTLVNADAVCAVDVRVLYMCPVVVGTDAVYTSVCRCGVCCRM